MYNSTSSNDKSVSIYDNLQFHENTLHRFRIYYKTWKYFEIKKVTFCCMWKHVRCHVIWQYHITNNNKKKHSYYISCLYSLLFPTKSRFGKKNAINLGKIYNAFIIMKKRTKYAIRKNKYFLLWNINRNILNVFRYAFSTIQQTNASRVISIRNA